MNRTEILFLLLVPNKHNLTDHCAKCNKEIKNAIKKPVGTEAEKYCIINKQSYG